MLEETPLNEVIAKLNTDPVNGLTNEEAQRRLKENGLNKLEEKKADPWWKIFFSQFKDPMVLILGLAAIISLVLGIITLTGGGEDSQEGWYDIIDVIIIFGVVIINAAIGTVQEKKAQKALDALKKLSSPTATVKREGAIMEILAEEVVVGDLIILEEGRVVPADLRLTKSVLMKADESSLTGESVPVEKGASFQLSEPTSIGDRVNEVFMSTPIVGGHGEGIVIATGMNSEIGRIASMLNDEEESMTPLQKKLNGLSKFLGILTMILVALMMLIKVIYAVINGNLESEWAQALLDSVALAVAAIPEGLTAVVTIVLALGVGKMVRVNAIVRRLASVETLGAVSVVCSDKTGTLTQNKMSVVAAYTPSNYLTSDTFSLDDLSQLATGMALCCDASIDGGVYGDPTEIALVEFADKLGLKKIELDSSCPRIDELPFDSVRKMMSTQHLIDDRKATYTKGALDMIKARCNQILDKGIVRKITQQDLSKIEEANKRMADNALRVLALATSTSNSLEEENLTFIGLVGMVDPPRESSKPAVDALKKAGIITIMITGDHAATALSIARQLGIAEKEEEVLSGPQIDALTPEELQEKVNYVRVFARVSPENKVEIVKAIKANGLIAAMTGDGVNDAPSLKAADIGIAMGIMGTDVAKGASDIVLADDNFATIEKAVEEGRGIYANIKKTILFLLSSNIGEVICMLLASCLGLPSPLIAIHLLWVNLITDSLPAIALGADRKPENIMDEKPRDPKESLFAHEGWPITFGYGVWIGLITFIAFLITPWQNGYFTISQINVFFENEAYLREAQSMAFTVLGFSELFHMLGMTNIRKSFIHVFNDKNLMLWISLFIGLGLQFFVIYTPGVNTVFRTAVDGVVEMQGLDLLWVFILAVSPLLIHEIAVFFYWLKKKLKKA